MIMKDDPRFVILWNLMLLRFGSISKSACYERLERHTTRGTK